MKLHILGLSDEPILTLDCQSTSQPHVAYAIRKNIADIYKHIKGHCILKSALYATEDNAVTGDIQINAFTGEFSVSYSINNNR